MSKNKIILGSSSPRRKELLSEIVSDFEIIPATNDEHLPIGISPIDAVIFLSFQKAANVDAQIKEKGEYANAIVIGADTVVDNGRIIGKPHDKEDALSMLMELSGKSHFVHTGVSLIGCGIKKVFAETTEVFFKSYKESDLTEYLDSDEPYDKAGAYAIQGYFGRFIDHIDGDFSNVMGLPVPRLKDILKTITE